MTDKEKMINLFKDLNISFEEMKFVGIHMSKNKIIESILTLSEQAGYAGFMAEFYFDRDDNYLSHGVYE